MGQDTFVQNFLVPDPGHTVGATAGSTRSIGADPKQFRMQELQGNDDVAEGSQLLSPCIRIRREQSLSHTRSKFDAVADSESAAPSGVSMQKQHAFATDDVQKNDVQTEHETNDHEDPSPAQDATDGFFCPHHEERHR